MADRPLERARGGAAVTRLFGTDGVRGLAGKAPLTPAFVRRLGYGAGLHYARQGGRVLIVRDTRTSGPLLQKALAQGLAAAGVRVWDGGVLPTPAVAVVAAREKLAGGAVVSASHNPAPYNGIKFFDGAGRKISDAVEDAIECFARAKDPVPAGGAPVLPAPKVATDYLEFLRGSWPTSLSLRGFRLVIDCAQGATAEVGPRLFRALGADLTVLFDRPNGRNINDGCGALHPGRLADVVKERGASLGVAFDGDGDRAIFVDEEGQIRDGDAILLACARHLKAAGRLRANTVVVTVMANLGLRRALKALGIDAVETPVGDKHVGEALSRTGAVLGGESSGHVIFREFLPTGDGLLCALQVLAALRTTERPLSVLTALAAPYPHVLLNLPMKERRPLESVRGFDERRRRVEAELGATGRALIRYSGTEPLLRIYLEGPDRGRLQAHAAALAEPFHAAGLTLETSSHR